MASCPLAGVSTIVMANVSLLFCKGGLAKSLFRCLPFSFYFTHTVLAWPASQSPVAEGETVTAEDMVQ